MEEIHLSLVSLDWSLRPLVCSADPPLEPFPRVIEFVLCRSRWESCSLRAPLYRSIVSLSWCVRTMYISQQLYVTYDQFYTSPNWICYNNVFSFFFFSLFFSSLPYIYNEKRFVNSIDSLDHASSVTCNSRWRRGKWVAPTIRLTSGPKWCGTLWY